MSKTNTQTKIELTSLQQALIDSGLTELTFTSHKQSKSVKVEDTPDKMILMLLGYGIQRKPNDSINGILKDCRDSGESFDESEKVAELLSDFCDKIKSGDFTNKANAFESMLKKQIKLWLCKKGFANTKSFDKEVNKMDSLTLLKTFTKGASAEDTDRRYKALQAVAQAELDKDLTSGID